MGLGFLFSLAMTVSFYTIAPKAAICAGFGIALGATKYLLACG
jgi:hypothetical protein